MKKLQTSRKFSLGGLKLAAMDEGLCYIIDKPTALHQRIRVWRSAQDVEWDHKALIVCTMLQFRYPSERELTYTRRWELCYVMLPGATKCHECDCNWSVVYLTLRQMGVDHLLAAGQYEI
jgi:hypothetical protein